MPHRIAPTTTARAALAVGALAGALVLIPTVAQAAPAASHATSAIAAAHGSVDPATSLRRGAGCIWGPPGDIGAATDRARSDDGSSTPPRIHC
ncbi:hypothetical protein [Clavibacter michiganensis]|uniref:hypothetical protein n=1 Tax=Clavibacter michiganensis TaxID=28447 RepID=UPI00292DE0FF|nr:hypothetical protein [Clavibacter michiganensis]